jgi:hypothetical protein
MLGIKSYVGSIAMVVCTTLVQPVELRAETLEGSVGNSAKWGVGWLDLESFTDFKTGDQLEIRVGGTAKRVLVRFLRKGASPDSPDGIEGGPWNVPANRVLTITLGQDRRRVGQISVHGGVNPWGTYPLGKGNGPATVISIERKKSRARGDDSRAKE